MFFFFEDSRDVKNCYLEHGSIETAAPNPPPPPNPPPVSSEQLVGRISGSLRAVEGKLRPWITLVTTGPNSSPPTHESKGIERV